MVNACTVAYVCLAGAGAGCFLLSCLIGCFALPGSHRFAVVGCGAGAVSVGLAVLFLVFDLGRPELAWRVFLAPGTSIVSLGAWFIGVFLLFSFCFGVFGIIRGVRFSLPFTICSVMLSLAVMSYTGVLFYAIEAVSFWHSILLPLFFVASSLTMGAAMAAIANAVLPTAVRVGVRRLEAMVRLLSVVEFAFAMLYLCRALFLGTDTTMILIWGELSPVFYAGGVVCGFVVPWLLPLVITDSRNAEFRSLVVAGSVLIGGVCMRCVILFAPFIHA